MSANISHGLACEDLVRQFCITKKKYILVAQRLKTPYAEVDLVFKNSQNQLVMIEVKSCNRDEFMTNRISYKQKQRLFRARQFLQENSKKEVLLFWAFVSIGNSSSEPITLLDAF